MLCYSTKGLHHARVQWSVSKQHENLTYGLVLTWFQLQLKYKNSSLAHLPVTVAWFVCEVDLLWWICTCSMITSLYILTVTCPIVVYPWLTKCILQTHAFLQSPFSVPSLHLYRFDQKPFVCRFLLLKLLFHYDILNIYDYWCHPSFQAVRWLEWRHENRYEHTNDGLPVKAIDIHQNSDLRRHQ